MRANKLARALDLHRAQLPGSAHLNEAVAQLRDRFPPLDAEDIATRFGVLLHYTQSTLLPRIVESGHIGFRGMGVWLTATALGGGLAPYDLGLNGPVDVAIVVDPRQINGGIWGPGAAGPSRAFSHIWRGGGLEFYVDAPIPVAAIVEVVGVEPAGDV